jgi:DNA polymerase III epsilon subunit-like protein
MDEMIKLWQGKISIPEAFLVFLKKICATHPDIMEKLRLSRPLAFIDLETTGTDIGKDRICGDSPLSK